MTLLLHTIPVVLLSPQAAPPACPHRAPAVLQTASIPSAQDSGNKVPGKNTGVKKTKPRWPSLKPVRRSLAREKIGKLGARNAKTVAASRKQLLRYGAGVCPILLKALHPSRSPAIRAQLRSILDELAGPDHADALALAYDPRNEPRSLYLVERLRSFKLGKLRPFFVKATKHRSMKVSHLAWLARAELGDLDSLPYLLGLAKENWKDRARDIVEVLPALKGEKATTWLVGRVREKELKTKLAALRLLWGAGTLGCVPVVSVFLDSREYVLRIGAVNALRGIVDGEMPYKHLSVFDAIDEVKKWKRRVGR